MEQLKYSNSNISDMVAWYYWGLIMAKTFSLGLYVISANIDWDCVKLGKVLFVLVSL